MDLTPQQQAALLDAARETIRATLAAREGADLSPPAQLAPPDDALDPALRQPAGCFVSLHALRTHRLRGCVGRLDAAGPLIEALRSAAVSVLEDPRFADNPVRLDELPDLEIELSVLAPLRDVESPLDFEPRTDGIYLTCGPRSGCFLPQVARETGWSREQLLDRLCTEKMGLPAKAWRDANARLSVFSTLLVGPEPFVVPSSTNEVEITSFGSGTAR